jgi:hypothetical protein
MRLPHARFTLRRMIVAVAINFHARRPPSNKCRMSIWQSASGRLPKGALRWLSQHRPREALESLVREQGLDTNTAWRENVRGELPHISTTVGTRSSDSRPRVRPVVGAPKPMAPSNLWGATAVPARSFPRAGTGPCRRVTPSSRQTRAGGWRSPDPCRPHRQERR